MDPLRLPLIWDGMEPVVMINAIGLPLAEQHRKFDLL